MPQSRQVTSSRRPCNSITDVLPAAPCTATENTTRVCDEERAAALPPPPPPPGVVAKALGEGKGETEVEGVDEGVGEAERLGNWLGVLEADGQGCGEAELLCCDEGVRGGVREALAQ